MNFESKFSTWNTFQILLFCHLIKIGDNWSPFFPTDLTCIEKWKWQLLLEVWFGTESDMSCLLVDCDACYVRTTISLLLLEAYHTFDDNKMRYDHCPNTDKMSWKWMEWTCAPMQLRSFAFSPTGSFQNQNWARKIIP